MVQENDIYFVLNKTKLPIKKLVLLLEEERDFNLLIYSIASSLSPEDFGDLFDLSFKLRFKLLFYHHSHAEKMDFDESIFIGNLCLHNYDYFFRKGRVLDKTQPSDILSLCRSLKGGALKSAPKDHFKSLLNNNNTPNLLANFNKWTIFLNKIKPVVLGVTIIDN